MRSQFNNVKEAKNIIKNVERYKGISRFSNLTLRAEIKKDILQRKRRIFKMRYYIILAVADILLAPIVAIILTFILRKCIIDALSASPLSILSGLLSNSIVLYALLLIALLAIFSVVIISVAKTLEYIYFDFLHKHPIVAKMLHIGADRVHQNINKEIDDTIKEEKWQMRFQDIEKGTYTES